MARYRRNPEVRWSLVQKHAPEWARKPVTRQEVGALLDLIDEPDLADSADGLAGMLESLGFDQAAQGLRTPTKVRFALRSIELQEALTKAQQAEWVRHAVPRALKAGDTTVAEVAQELGISEAEVRSTFGV